VASIHWEVLRVRLDDLVERGRLSDLAADELLMHFMAADGGAALERTDLRAANEAVGDEVAETLLNAAYGDDPRPSTDPPVHQPPAPISPAPGTLIGAWRIGGKLGTGATAEVFAVTHEGKDERRALKLLRPGLDASARERFFRELDLALHPPHDAILRAKSVGQWRGRPYGILELAHGTLDDRLRRSVLEPEQTCRLLIPIAQALAALHRGGNVHRDVKPANIFIRADGSTALGDLGLVASTDARTRLTLAAGFVGTPAYAPPEQFATGAEPSPCWDVHALAASAFHAMTGDPPWGRPGVGSNPLRPYPARTRAFQNLPANARALLANALAVNPSLRLATIEALARDLARVAGGETPLARGPRATDHLRGWIGLHRRWAGALVLLASALSLGALAPDARRRWNNHRIEATIERSIETDRIRAAAEIENARTLAAELCSAPEAPWVLPPLPAPAAMGHQWVAAGEVLGALQGVPDSLEIPAWADTDAVLLRHLRGSGGTRLREDARRLRRRIAALEAEMSPLALRTRIRTLLVDSGSDTELLLDQALRQAPLRRERADLRRLALRLAAAETDPPSAAAADAALMLAELGHQETLLLDLAEILLQDAQVDAAERLLARYRSAAWSAAARRRFDQLRKAVRLAGPEPWAAIDAATENATEDDPSWLSALRPVELLEGSWHAIARRDGSPDTLYVARDHGIREIVAIEGGFLELGDLWILPDSLRNRGSISRLWAPPRQQSSEAPDFVARLWPGEGRDLAHLLLLRRNGTTLTVVGAMPMHASTTAPVAWGDLDGDGGNEIAIGGDWREPTMALWAIGPDGRYAPQPRLRLTGGEHQFIAFVDVDEDGRDELLVRVDGWRRCGARLLALDGPSVAAGAWRERQNLPIGGATRGRIPRIRTDQPIPVPTAESVLGSLTSDPPERCRLVHHHPPGLQLFRRAGGELRRHATIVPPHWHRGAHPHLPAGAGSLLGIEGRGDSAALWYQAGNVSLGRLVVRRALADRSGGESRAIALGVFQQCFLAELDRDPAPELVHLSRHSVDRSTGPVRILGRDGGTKSPRHNNPSSGPLAPASPLSPSTTRWQRLSHLVGPLPAPIRARVFRQVAQAPANRLERNQARLEWARACLEQRRYSEASRILETIEGGAEVHLARAELLARRGEWSAAQAELAGIHSAANQGSAQGMLATLLAQRLAPVMHYENLVAIDYEERLRWTRDDVDRPTRSAETMLSAGAAIRVTAELTIASIPLGMRIAIGFRPGAGLHARPQDRGRTVGLVFGPSSGPGERNLRLAIAPSRSDRASPEDAHHEMPERAALGGGARRLRIDVEHVPTMGITLAQIADSATGEAISRHYVEEQWQVLPEGRTLAGLFPVRAADEFEGDADLILHRLEVAVGELPEPLRFGLRRQLPSSKPAEG